MTLIRQWFVVGDSFPEAAEELDFSVNIAVSAGATLIRTAGRFDFTETVNFPHFPPDPPRAVAAGAFLHPDSSTQGLPPFAGDGDGEWLWWQTVPFTAGFGAISAIQSDLTWDGGFYFDSKGRRKATVDNPCLTVSFAGVGDLLSSTPRTRTVSGSFWLRMLWEHED